MFESYEPEKKHDVPILLGERRKTIEKQLGVGRCSDFEMIGLLHTKESSIKM
jgi:hypothetical protein